MYVFIVRVRDTVCVRERESAGDTEMDRERDREREREREAARFLMWKCFCMLQRIAEVQVKETLQRCSVLLR